MKEDLRRHLLDFDGRALTLLGETEVLFQDMPNYVTALIQLFGDNADHVSSGATWLLKSHLEKGGKIEAKDLKQMFSNLESVRDWQSQLHICQCFQYLDLPSKQSVKPIWEWLVPLTESLRPFLRAWSADALFRLQTKNPALHEDWLTIRARLTDDPKASVRARLRQLI